MSLLATVAFLAHAAPSDDWSDPLAFELQGPRKLLTTTEVTEVCRVMVPCETVGANPSSDVKAFCTLENIDPNAPLLKVPSVDDFRAATCEDPERADKLQRLSAGLGTRAAAEGLASFLLERAKEELGAYVVRKATTTICAEKGEDHEKIRSAMMAPAVCTLVGKTASEPARLLSSDIAAPLQQAATRDLVAAPRNLAEELLRLDVLNSADPAAERVPYDVPLTLAVAGRTAELMLEGASAQAALGAWARSANARVDLPPIAVEVKQTAKAGAQQKEVRARSCLALPVPGVRPEDCTEIDAPLATGGFLLSELVAILPEVVVRRTQHSWQVDDVPVRYLAHTILIARAGGTTLGADELWTPVLAKAEGVTKDVDAGKRLLGWAGELTTDRPEDALRSVGDHAWQAAGRRFLPVEDAQRGHLAAMTGSVAALVSELAPALPSAHTEGAAAFGERATTASELLFGDGATAVVTILRVVAEEAPEQARPALSATTRLLGMLQGVSQASDADGVEKALETWAAPAGGYLAKREPEPPRLGYVTVNSYVGVAGALGPDGHAFFAPTATLGPEAGLRLGRANLGLHVPVLDVGRLVEVELTDEQPDATRPLDVRDMLSPGLQLTAGGWDLPVALGLQGSMLPNQDSWRLGVILAVDVVVLP